MFAISSALMPPPRLWRIVTLPLALGSLLATTAVAQSGSVEFSIESMDRVLDPAGVNPTFGQVFTLPMQKTSTAPVDYLVLQRFAAAYIYDPEDEENLTVYSVAEYDAYSKTLDQMRESGLLAFTLSADETVGINGSNIIGFVRTTQVPSASATANEPGYLDNLHGSMEWDYLARTRSGYVTGTGAAYAPAAVHTDYVDIDSNGSTGVDISQFFIPINNHEYLRWGLAVNTLQPHHNRTGRDKSLYYGLINRNDSLVEADLMLDDADPANDIVPASFGAPWSFRNRLAVFLIHDLGDKDGDTIPDFLDFTYTLSTMPQYADYGGANNWYYSELLDDWVYSVRETVWDYSQKFGWIFVDPGVKRSNFFFYGASPELGWLWTSNRGYFPWVYRFSDASWLYWMPAGTGGENSATLYNSKTATFETIYF